MLVQPGSRASFVVTGDKHTVVLGRVRYHVDDDGGATRLRTAIDTPATLAVAVPAHLGGGTLLVGGDVMYRARDAQITPVVRGGLVAPSFLAKELVARLRTTQDWVALSLDGAPPRFVTPPLAAPILPPLPTSPLGAQEGRPSTPGPELVTATSGIALVPVLGPVITHDGGATFTPLVGRPPRFWPTRVTHDAQGGLLLTDDVAALPVTTSGSVGPLRALGPRALPPKVATLALEQSVVDGVALPDGRILIADGETLAVVQREPLRVLRVANPPDVTSCILRAAPAPSLAVAVCRRFHELRGDHVVVGTVEDDPTGLRLSVERIFPAGTGTRVSSRGAVAVAGTCAGHSDNQNLFTATRYCVRTPKGVFRDVTAVATLGDRLQAIPHDDGSLSFVRAFPEGAKGSPGAYVLSRADGQIVAEVQPFTKGKSRPELLAVDTGPDGRVVVWTRAEGRLRSALVEMGTGSVERHESLLPTDASVGVFAAHALVASVPEGVLVGLSSDDGGAKFLPVDLGPKTRPLDLSGFGRRVECGPLGCRLFGWTRLGWERALASTDTLVGAEGAPPLPKPPDPPKRATRLRATCTTLTSAQVDPAEVPQQTPWPAARDALLGLPEPKPAKGQSLALLPFVRGSVRGGFVTVGPTPPGAYGETGRTVARFATDFDPIGVVHESSASIAPYVDGNQASLPALHAYALGPGRALAAHCSWSLANRCAMFRLTAGAPLEPLPSPPGLTVQQIFNAREIGGTLLVVGTAYRNDVKPSTWGYEATGFAGTFGGGAWSVLTFAAPGAEDAIATTDTTHGRFGLFVASKVPTFLGGSAYALALDGSAVPGAGFEPLAGAVPELLRASGSCSSTLTAWDRGDTMVRDRPLEVVVDGLAEPALVSESGVLRSRVHGKGACLERLTSFATNAAFQWDASTGRAVLLRAAVPPMKAIRRTLSCSVEFRD